MKGISHFLSGVAVATFLPQAVRLAAEGRWILLLAGVGGMIPDTLDFRLARYLERPDVEVDPDPLAPDPQAMAEQVAAAIDRAYESGKPVTVRFHTLRLGPDLWRQYAVCLGGERGEVQVRIGPLVTASLAQGESIPLAQGESAAAESRIRREQCIHALQASPPPLAPGESAAAESRIRREQCTHALQASPPPLAQGESATRRVGRAPVAVPVRYAYDAEIQVDVFSGPSLALRRRPAPSQDSDGDVVQADLLPWHRRWSHSLVVTALLGGVIALWLGPIYGLVYALGAAMHILEDQLGYLGGNLFYPLTMRRSMGLGLFHSGDVLPNLFTVWLSVLLILFNLDRFSAAPGLNPWPTFGFGLLLPWAAILGAWWWRRQAYSRRRGQRGLSAGRKLVDVQAAELQAEVEEVES